MEMYQMQKDSSSLLREKQLRDYFDEQNPIEVRVFLYHLAQ